MAQQIINNNESGLSVRSRLNNMFSELYAAIILPLKLSGIGGNTQQVIAANTYVQAIYVSTTSGSPIIRIGISPNGEEIISETQPESFTQVNVERFFADSTTLYLTISGGTINIRFSVINEFY